MARKTQDTPSSIRIRENQKRSRARRKGLLESLQKRVQAFELNGFRATHEMQEAARRVVQENERLRSLLAFHGVLREEVDSYLRSSDESGATNYPQLTSIMMDTPVPCQSSTSDTVPSPASNAAPPTRNSVEESPSVSYLSGQGFEHDGHALGEPRSVNQYQGRDLTAQHPKSAPLHDHRPAALGSSLVISQRSENYSETQDTGRLNNRLHEFAISEKSDLPPNDADCFCPSTTAVEDGHFSRGI